MVTGSLYLIPNFIGMGAVSDEIPPRNLEIIKELRYYIAEDVRTARRSLKKMLPELNISELQFFELGKHTNTESIPEFLLPLSNGHSMGIISEAGMPCIADPGALVVSLAHSKGISVVPLVGPSSIFMALAASGFNGQGFIFHGYLPIDKHKRKLALQNMEKASERYKQTQIFMETPFRNNQLFAEILENCAQSTYICVASSICTDEEFIRTKQVSKWKESIPDINKKPTIFLLLKQ